MRNQKESVPFQDLVTSCECVLIQVLDIVCTVHNYMYDIHIHVILCIKHYLDGNLQDQVASSKREITRLEFQNNELEKQMMELERGGETRCGVWGGT